MTRSQRVSDLEAIAYISNAARGLTEAQLEQLLASSRERNQKLSITGALLFDNDIFSSTSRARGTTWIGSMRASAGPRSTSGCTS